MSVAWPSDLPQYARITGHTHTPTDNVLRSAVGNDFANLRKSSGMLENPLLNVELTLTRAQAESLLDFYTTTAAVADVVTWSTLSTRTLYNTYRFAGPPVFAFVENDYWKATFTMEEVPS